MHVYDLKAIHLRQFPNNFELIPLAKIGEICSADIVIRFALSLEIDLLLDVDLILVVSPIYRASYPGMVKAFFDELPHEALINKVALPIMVGGTDRHYLATRYTWAVMLQELGAIVPKALFILDSSIDKERDLISDEAVESFREPLKISLAIANALAEI